MSAARVFRALIVDDEPVARATIQRLLSTDAETEIVGECANGKEALEAVRSATPDVIFLDVQMPEVDGLAFLEALADEQRPAIVFTTAFDRYATKAFDERATDYLLKPFSDERFFVALERAKESVRTTALVRAGQRVADLVDSHGRAVEGAGNEPIDRLSIHKEGSIEIVKVAQIDWIQSADQYVRIHTSGGEHLMRGSMGEMERLLDPACFARVHRSAIVALDRVRRLETGSGRTGRVLLADGTWVPVSRSRVPVLRRLLG